MKEPPLVERRHREQQARDEPSQERAGPARHQVRGRPDIERDAEEQRALVRGNRAGEQPARGSQERGRDDVLGAGEGVWSRVEDVRLEEVERLRDERVQHPVDDPDGGEDIGADVGRPPVAGVLRVDQARTVDDVVAPMERHGPRAGDRGRGRHQRDDEVKAPRQGMDHRTGRMRSAGAAAVGVDFGTSASAASARAIASAASACPAGAQWTSHS